MLDNSNCKPPNGTGIVPAKANYMLLFGKLYTPPGHDVKETVDIRVKIKANTQLAFNCSKLTIGTLENGEEYVQS